MENSYKRYNSYISINKLWKMHQVKNYLGTLIPPKQQTFTSCHVPMYKRQNRHLNKNADKALMYTTLIYYKLCRITLVQWQHTIVSLLFPGSGIISSCSGLVWDVNLLFYMWQITDYLQEELSSMFETVACFPRKLFSFEISMEIALLEL